MVRLTTSNPLIGATLGCLLALAALMTAAAGQEAPGDKRGAKRKSESARNEVLERFRRLSPEARLRLVEKLADATVFVPVTRGPLDVAIVERGAVEAADAVGVVCRVRGRSPSSTVATTIRWVIDDGTAVQKGDVLVRLDDSELRERLAAQKAAVEKATADKSAAEEALELTRKRAQRDSLAAEIELKMARLALKRFTGRDPDEKEIFSLKVDHAQVGLETARLEGRAGIVRAQAAVKARTATLAAAREGQQETEQSIAACVIRAPRDGLAVYHPPEGTHFGRAAALIAQGEAVREGQLLLRVVGLERFTVGAKVHEALVSRARAGQKVAVRVDAFPGQLLRGEVKAVATVASRSDWVASDVKVYPVLVTLAGPTPRLKPGMSAEVRIEVERRANALQAPVGAVVRSGRETICYVKVGKELQERAVKTRPGNDRFVEVTEGLKDGEVVLGFLPDVTAVRRPAPGSK